MGKVEVSWGGVNMSLNEEDNSKISCFGWFVGELNKKEWENYTHEVFDKVSDLDKIAIDLGGWIGVTSLYLSKKFKRVIVVEADSIACEALRKNLITNNCENVDVIEKCVFNGTKEKVSFGKNSYHYAPLGSSMSQIKEVHEFDDYEISTVTLRELEKLCGTDELGFIKVDIEGGEENILEDLFEICELKKCVLLLSFHLGWWSDSNLDRFECFRKRQYKVYTETGEINPTSIIDFLKNHHLTSLLFDFK